MATAVFTRDPAATPGSPPVRGPVAAPPSGSAGLPVPAPEAQEVSRPIALPRRAYLPVWRATAPHRRPSVAVWSFVVIVALPMALAAAYYFVVAADQYVAEFRFALRSAAPVHREAAIWLPATEAPTPVVSDSYIVVQYIRSRAMIDDLERTIDLREMFSTRRADWPARLHLPASIEELVLYWTRQADAFFDASNGTIVVRVRAFTREDALRLAERVLGLSEELVNRLSEHARQNALQDSEAAVGRTERRLAVALARLRDFRDDNGLIDPNKSVNSTVALTDRLRDSLVRAKTELSVLRQYMKDDAPPVALLEARIRSLEAERRSLDGEVTATAKSGAHALSRVMGRYEELETERRFAENSYQHALEALDQARREAERQQVYLAAFVPPRLPEEALYPRRARSLAIVFLVAFAVWSIGGLGIRSVRDHL
jgi:capsular polysaccharide transport system permease protein